MAGTVCGKWLGLILVIGCLLGQDAFGLIPGTCYIRNEHAAKPVDMAFYLAGLNHARDESKMVSESGANEFAEFVHGQVGNADNIVIVLDASGPVLGSKGWKHNGKYLADRLSQLTGISYTFRAYPRPEWQPSDRGSAFILGPRYQVDERNTKIVGSGEEQALQISIMDRQKSFMVQKFYVYHTSGGNIQIQAITFGVKHAAANHVTGEFYPLHMGDFNIGGGDDRYMALANYARNTLKWHDDRVTCFTSPSGGGQLEFSIENEKMHVFEQSEKSDVKMDCVAGRLIPIRLYFSIGGNGAPNDPGAGIRLSDIAHNIVGFGFYYQGSGMPSECQPAELTGGKRKGAGSIWASIRRFFSTSTR